MPTQTKICERCQRTKPAAETYFGINLRFRDKLQPFCRECGAVVAAERRQRKNERSKTWYANNKEKARQAARDSWERNRSERLAYLRRWREQNKAHIQQYQRAYVERKRQDG